MAREKSITEKWRDWRLDGEPFKNQFSEITAITEAKELPERDIKLLTKMTDMNNHNEARVHLARKVGNKNLVKGYEAIMVLHSMFNQMNEMMAARTKLDKMLFTQAKRYFSNFDDINKAF